MSTSAPLSGLTVVELGHSVAAPYAGLILAELGARVVKVEKKEGGDPTRDWGPPYFADGTATLYHALNRTKESVTVDLGSEGERAALSRFILDHADAVLQNLRAGAVDRAGLDARTLRTQKPALIYCNMHAFGAHGPLSDRPGYDPLMQAFGGIMSVTGEGQGRPPVRVGTSVVDMGTGLWAVIGILAALAERNRTGEGCVVDTSLYETAIAWMLSPLMGYQCDGKVRAPLGSGMGEIVPYQAFATADGYLMVAAGNDNLWRRLCGALERPDLAADEAYRTNGQRVRARAELVPVLEAAFRQRGMEDWAARLEAAGVPNAPIHRVNEVMTEAQARALGIFLRPQGAPIEYVGLPLSFDGERPVIRHLAPGLGQGNRDVLGLEPPPAKAAE